MQRRFYYLLIPVACLCSLATALAIICIFRFFKLCLFLIRLIFENHNWKVVKDQPEKPPSMAQYEIRNNQSKDLKKEQSDFQLFKTSLVNLFKNLNFCLILISYGNFDSQ
jgi:hypothetical protein